MMDTQGSSVPGLTHVVIVNWNGWQDTLRCLESVLRSDHHPLEVVVVDNGSADGSVERICEWAAGRLAMPRSGLGVESKLGEPPIVKPVPFAVIRGPNWLARGAEDPPRRLTIVALEANVGFGGASNVGIRYALASRRCDYVWLLNNDTMVREDALSALVSRMRAVPTAGMCGSTLVQFDHPEILQARAGGQYIRWLAITRHVGEGEPVDRVVVSESVEGALDYLVGASLLVSAQFLADVGLLNEDYFLYFEDVDWALRARGRYRLAYASSSLVYHKHGASTGMGVRPIQRPLTTDFYWLRNRLRITARHYAYALPVVLSACVGSLVRRALMGGPARALRLAWLLATLSWRSAVRPEDIEPQRMSARP